MTEPLTMSGRTALGQIFGGECDGTNLKQLGVLWEDDTTMHTSNTWNRTQKVSY